MEELYGTGHAAPTRHAQELCHTDPHGKRVYIPDLYDMYDLYELAHVAGRKPQTLHGVGHVSWVGSDSAQSLATPGEEQYDLDHDLSVDDLCKVLKPCTVLAREQSRSVQRASVSFLC